MKPLRLSGALKVAAGITTLEEVVKVAAGREQRRLAEAPCAHRPTSGIWRTAQHSGFLEPSWPHPRKRQHGPVL
jgi:hypothetical protein